MANHRVTIVVVGIDRLHPQSGVAWVVSRHEALLTARVRFGRDAELLPGIVEVQSVTLDDPEELPPDQHIQAAERLGWMERAHELPSVQRFPEPA